MSTEELQVFLTYFREIDTNGSCHWEISPRKITIYYYFHKENMDINPIDDIVHKYLNHSAANFGLLH